jgi:hypothetical protein
LPILAAGDDGFDTKHVGCRWLRDDIEDELRRLGVEMKLISLNLMVGFLKDRLVDDANLPADSKEMKGKIIDDLEKDFWIEAQINKFLSIVLETQKNLHFPEWTSAFEKYTSKPKAQLVISWISSGAEDFPGRAAPKSLLGMGWPKLPYYLREEVFQKLKKL